MRVKELSHLPSLPQQMSPNREPGHRSTSQDVKHIERRKKECSHARHPTPAPVIAKWTISAANWCLSAKHPEPTPPRLPNPASWPFSTCGHFDRFDLSRKGYVGQPVTNELLTNCRGLWQSKIDSLNFAGWSIRNNFDSRCRVAVLQDPPFSIPSYRFT